MKRIFLVIFFLVFPKIVFANIIINEIMYNPSDSDNNKEFIEIFSFPQTDLSNYIISDGDSNDTLNLFYFNKKSNYSLIVEDDFLIETNNASIYKIGATIGNGLSSDDMIYLYQPNGNLIDSAEINSSIANGNGYSMEYFNGSFFESITVNGTPGYENSISQGITPTTEKTKNIILKTYLDGIAYTNSQYTNLFKIEIKNKDDCSKKDLVTVSYNITNPILIKQDEFTKEVGCSSYASTGEFTPTMPGNYTLCGAIINSTINETDFSDNSACMNFEVIDTSAIPCNITINITTNETIIYEAGQSIKFETLLNNEYFPFIIEYWIEDLFGNIYKNKYNTTNTNQKSWKTDIKEQDRVLFIKSIVYPSCNDSNSSDNYAEKMFIVKSESNDFAEGIEESSLEIMGVDDKVKFGDVADVEVDVYKGKTNKYSISLWVEDDGEKVSETTKIHMYDKYSSYHGQLPIKLDNNCDLKLKDGTYDVVLNGLDKEYKEKIKIEGIKTSLCSKSSSTKTSSSSDSEISSSSKKFDYILLDYPKKISAGGEFDINVEIDNNDDKDSTVDIWSYVYRGSKSYSGERTSNKKHIIVEKYSSEIIKLTNKIDNVDEGDYKLKVVINKDNQKTNNEITEDIKIINNNVNLENINFVDNEIGEIEENKITQNVVKSTGIVYESSTEKTKKLVILFLLLLSVFINIILIWRR